MKDDYKINIIIDTGKSCPDEASLKNAAEKTLRLEKIKKGASLNILLTGDKRIQRLNRQFLGRDEPTDVIAFGMKRGGHLKGFIGDIVVSVETAECNSRRFNTTKRKEILLYIIHGILHLLGYGDETKKETRIIQERQNRILDAICGES